MSVHRHVAPASPQERPPAPGSASGTGSDTALEALIRQRKQAQRPDDPAPPPAAPTAATPLP